KTISVVQGEQRLAVQHTILGDGSQRGVKDLHAVFEGFAEAFLFLAQDLLDARLLGGKLRIGVAHLGHQIRHQLMEKQARLTQLVAMAQSTANDAAQYIATAFVAGNDAVYDQKAAGAYMVGNHLEGIVVQIRYTGFARRRLDERLE